jgi:hypothetical protein
VRPIDTAESRAATNELLGQLRDDHWRPQAWTQFLVRAVQRSTQQARLRPRAFAEATALHGALFAAGRRPWTLTSWVLTITHLGLLEGRRTLGAANAVTLLRANLPTVAPSRWLGLVALGADVLDGQLARRSHTETLFGAHADSLADAAFWLWFAARYEPNRLLRAAALGTWAAPVLAFTTASVAGGRLIDPPRPVAVRPAAAMQALLAARALHQSRTHSLSR